MEELIVTLRFKMTDVCRVGRGILNSGRVIETSGNSQSLTRLEHRVWVGAEVGDEVREMS